MHHCKKSLTVIFLFSIIFHSTAQINPILEVKEYTLDNGFKVVLNYDSTATNVFGAILVNAGSKHESPDATGMAHYLEHLLFKGTDQLGTVNYQAEKIHLDSITLLYDQMALTATKEDKLSLQRQINEQAVKASQYGLPNEFDKLLREIGGTGINAFTNKEMTFYHNSFPGNELEKWMSLYAERFRNPIFRSFQSELEVVYEEKNRAMDNMERKVFEETNKLVYPNHSYGQWTTLGKVEHLKNPSISAMQAFYDKYYVANNMALILSGNFDSDEAKNLANKYFKSLKADSKLDTEVPAPEPIIGNPVAKRRITPVRVAVISYQTPAAGHPDRVAMDIIEHMLFNQGETGLLNKLQLDNEMLYVGAFSNIQNESSIVSVFYVPKIIGQSLGAAEKKVKREFSRIMSGEFEESFMNAAKSTIGINFQKSMENNVSRGIRIGESLNQGENWAKTLAYPDQINKVTKNDIIRVANQYFGENYAKLISRTGFGKKKRLDKPPFKPVKTAQTGSSVFAKNWESLKSTNLKPKFVDFDKDIEIVSANTHSIYASKNPVNDLFYMTINFKTGRLNYPKLTVAAQSMNYVATAERGLQDIKKAFSEIGCTYYFSASANYASIRLEGKEVNLPKALSLVNEILKEGQATEKTKDLVYNEVKTSRKLENRNPNVMGNALFSYATIGDLSFYSSREALNEIKKTSVDEYINLFKLVADTYQAEILFSGNTSAKKLNDLLFTSLELSDNLKEDELNPILGRNVRENIIYVVKDKKAVQSQIYFYVEGDKYSKDEFGMEHAFDEYFGGGFSGLALQEIREYRSLAYSAGANYSTPIFDQLPGKFYTYIGCQADKSNEAIEVMQGLVTKMPLKKDREEMLQKSLTMKINTNFPDFKELPSTVRDWQMMGYTQDPNKQAASVYNEISMENINQFYEKHVAGKPYVITVYGDLTRIDLDRLSKLGKIIEVDKKDFFVK